MGTLRLPKEAYTEKPVPSCIGVCKYECGAEHTERRNAKSEAFLSVLDDSEGGVKEAQQEKPPAKATPTLSQQKQLVCCCMTLKINNSKLLRYMNETSCRV
jgi:hypothetical protein